MIEKNSEAWPKGQRKNWTDFCVGYIAKWVGISQKMNKFKKKNNGSLFSVAIVENV